MKFRITTHAGHAAPVPPGDAIDVLWQRLGASRNETTFARVGHEISASWGEDVPASMERDERAEIGRRAVLAIVREVCESTPELELGWFAVGYFR
jgi:hypothetical protein